MDLLRRVRWGNVARAAALLVAVALVLAWPQLRSDPPPLPPEPALAAPPAPAPPREESAEFGVEPSVKTPRERPRARRRWAPRHRAPKRRAVARPAPQVAPVSPPAPAPVWMPPSPQSEFGFGE